MKRVFSLPYQRLVWMPLRKDCSDEHHRDLYVLAQDVLARSYGLSAQLNCLNYCHLCKERTDDGINSSSRNNNGSPRWVLADLTRDKIRSLQQQAGEKEIGQGGWRGFIDEVVNLQGIQNTSLYMSDVHEYNDIRTKAVLQKLLLY